MKNIISPDPDCPICKGTGCMLLNNKKVTCSCIIKQQAILYLTPLYEAATYYKQLDVSKIINNSILMDTISVSRFKSFVKSFLLNTGMIFNHETISAYDIVKEYLSPIETSKYKEYSSTEFLIVCFMSDPPNKAYSNIIIPLLQQRLFRNKPTWIFSSNRIDSSEFSFHYGKALVEYLQSSSFIKLQ